MQTKKKKKLNLPGRNLVRKTWLAGLDLGEAARRSSPGETSSVAIHSEGKLLPLHRRITWVTIEGRPIATTAMFLAKRIKPGLGGFAGPWDGVEQVKIIN